MLSEAHAPGLPRAAGRAAAARRRKAR